MSLEAKYAEWIAKTDFNWETGKWEPSLEEFFAETELVKLKGRRRVIRYMEADMKNARHRLKKAITCARKCQLTSALSFHHSFNEYVDKAMHELSEGLERGLSKEEVFLLSMKLGGRTSHVLTKQVEVADALVKGCRIDRERVGWSMFGKNTLEAKHGLFVGRLDTETIEYKQCYFCKKLKPVADYIHKERGESPGVMFTDVFPVCEDCSKKNRTVNDPSS